MNPEIEDWSFLSRLLPKRLQRRAPLANEERLKLLAGVADHDPCLRAVQDLGQELLESEFHRVIDAELPDEQRLRACDGLRMAYYQLRHLEDQHAAAKRWREELERQKSNG